MITDFDVSCPYCGEIFNTLIDYSPLFDGNHLIDSADTQAYTYIEDCQICCQPILFTPIVGQDGQLLDVVTKQENE